MEKKSSLFYLENLKYQDFFFLLALPPRGQCTQITKKGGLFLKTVAQPLFTVTCMKKTKTYKQLKRKTAE